jgi:8-oxo-dGTP pyrophosphatase MutT (NUDIX family)
MTIAIDDIQSVVNGYLRRYPHERGRLSNLLAALAAGWSLASRRESRGHVTCGALLIDPHGRSLHVRHKTLGRWLLPGGHLEDGDSSLLQAALRELREETTIAPEQIEPIRDAAPIDIDVHAIPANGAKGEPEHWHADFVYAFRVTTAEVVLDLDEVTDFAWLRRPAIASVASKLEPIVRSR